MTKVEREISLLLGKVVQLIDEGYTEIKITHYWGTIELIDEGEISSTFTNDQEHMAHRFILMAYRYELIPIRTIIKA